MTQSTSYNYARINTTVLQHNKLGVYKMVLTMSGVFMLIFLILMGLLFLIAGTINIRYPVRANIWAKEKLWPFLLTPFYHLVKIPLVHKSNSLSKKHIVFIRIIGAYFAVLGVIILSVTLIYIVKIISS